MTMRVRMGGFYLLLDIAGGSWVEERENLKRKVKREEIIKIKEWCTKSDGTYSTVFINIHADKCTYR